MGKLLRLQDLLLFSAAFIGDSFEEARSVGDVLPSVMRQRYGYVPAGYRKNSYIKTVAKLVSVRDLNKVVDKKGNVYLELTSKGERVLRRRFPLFMRDKKWDGSFMVVIFDIPEKDKRTRNKIRLKLTELGFGMLQKSVWISPYHFEEDMREFVVNNGLADSVYILKARMLLAGDYGRLTEKIWKPSELNQAYLRLADEAVKDPRKALTKYLRTLSRDPMLPKELLPKDWSRDKVLAELNSGRTGNSRSSKFNPA